MAKVLTVSVRGIYDWLKRAHSKRACEDELLTEKRFRSSRFTYGSAGIQRELRAAGYGVGRKRLAHLMREAGIRGRRKFKCPTKAKRTRLKAEKLIKQNVSLAATNPLFASDSSYLPTLEGWLYLAVTLALFSCKIGGWVVSYRPTADLTLSALELAIK